MEQDKKSEKSRTAILEAALDLFSSQGYRGTSIRDVAQRAGVSTGNVYHHFADKNEILTEVARDIAGWSVVRTGKVV